MREILFRGFHECENGKHKVFVTGEWIKGEWVNGYYSALKAPSTGEIKHVIFSFDRVVDYVIPETVGEYSGENDRNGKQIFEGDIVKAIHKSNYAGVPDTDFGIGVIEYDNSYYGGAAYKINIIGESGSRVFSNNLEVKVIGNIYDNPELLKGASNA